MEVAITKVEGEDLVADVVEDKMDLEEDSRGEHLLGEGDMVISSDISRR